MNKHEIYDALKADGAKLPKAERFMSVDDLKAIYTERFGVSPDEPVQRTEVVAPSDPIPVVMVQPEVDEEAPNSHLLRDADEPEPVAAVKDETIHLLRFAESGWCPALNRSYTRGLYRPATFAEYEALKPFAEEVV